MPLYEYRCEKCGVFEKLQKTTDKSLQKCPTCQGKVKRIISRDIGIAFKGPGFYCTDNRDVKERARAINKERQRDNQAILDKDVKSYVKQAEETTRKIQEM